MYVTVNCMPYETESAIFDTKLVLPMCYKHVVEKVAPFIAITRTVKARNDTEKLG